MGSFKALLADWPKTVVIIRAKVPDFLDRNFFFFEVFVRHLTQIERNTFLQVYPILSCDVSVSNI